MLWFICSISKLQSKEANAFRTSEKLWRITTDSREIQFWIGSLGLSCYPNVVPELDLLPILHLALRFLNSPTLAFSFLHCIFLLVLFFPYVLIFYPGCFLVLQPPPFTPPRKLFSHTQFTNCRIISWGACNRHFLLKTSLRYTKHFFLAGLPLSIMPSRLNSGKSSNVEELHRCSYYGSEVKLTSGWYFRLVNSLKSWFVYTESSTFLIPASCKCRRQAYEQCK